MTDRRSREKSLRELEFNDLNINLYLTLNYGTASEHLDFDFMVLYNVFCAFVGLKGAVCRILTLLKHKNTIICLQTFRKHVKLTYLFI